MASVLIIEDDNALREGLAETLSDLGYHAIEAASGRIGLDIAAREQIDFSISACQGWTVSKCCGTCTQTGAARRP
jgi:DNA-binding response OmpR family regulator